MHLQENGINISVINGTARAKVFFEYAEGNFNTPLDDLFEDVVGTQTGRTGAMRFYNVATRVYMVNLAKIIPTHLPEETQIDRLSLPGV